MSHTCCTYVCIHMSVTHQTYIQTMMWYSVRTHFCALCLQGCGVGCPASRHEAEVRIVASCPDDHHDRVMDICKGLGMFKAFGKKGDFIDALKRGDQWFDLWKAKVCQTVLVATMHAECGSNSLHWRRPSLWWRIQDYSRSEKGRERWCEETEQRPRGAGGMRVDDNGALWNTVRHFGQSVCDYVWVLVWCGALLAGVSCMFQGFMPFNLLR